MAAILRALRQTPGISVWILPMILCAMILGLISGQSALAGTMNEKRGTGQMKIRVILENTTLSATLDDTDVARDFAALMPFEVTLSDYSSTEKVADLPRKLDISNVPDSYTPKAGDITHYAPWGNLAIFYRGFSRSKGLVRLGQFDGPIDALLSNKPFKARFEIAE